MDVAMLMPNNGWKSLVIKLQVELFHHFCVLTQIVKRELSL